MPLTVPAVLCCAGILQKDDGTVLVVQRPFHKTMGGKWEFPGGKVELNETPQETIIRELFEELGIVVTYDQISPYTFVSYTYDNFHLNMFVFLVSAWEGDVILMEGQPDCKWLTAHDLEHYLMVDADEPIIKRLIQDRK